MRALESRLLAAIVVVAAGLAGLGLFHYGYAPMVVAFPLALAGVLVAFSGWRAAQLLRPRPSLEAGQARIAAPGWPAVLWIAAAPLSVLLFGFAIGLALFCAAFARGHGARWLVALALGLGMLAAIRLLFAGLLGLSGTGPPDWWPAEILSALPFRVRP